LFQHAQIGRYVAACNKYPLRVRVRARYSKTRVLIMVQPSAGAGAPTRGAMDWARGRAQKKTRNAAPIGLSKWCGFAVRFVRNCAGAAVR
jgi:hypothetical protein